MKPGLLLFQFYLPRAHHQYFVSNSMDPYLDCSASSATAHFFVADVNLCRFVMAKWEAAAEFARENGTLWPEVMVNNVWQTIAHVDPKLLARALSMCKLNTFSVPGDFHWDRQSVSLAYHMKKGGKEAFFYSPQTQLMLVKGMVAAKLPHLVERTEVCSFLPMSEVKWFSDLGIQVLR